MHYRVIEATRIEKGIEFRVINKLAQRNGKVFQLEAVALTETTDEFMRKLETLVDSFEVK